MSWQMDRNIFAQEMELRKLIREAISAVGEKKASAAKESLLKENELRGHIRRLVETEVGDKTPHQSTGINVLEDLLKKIIPVLQDGFYQLTTSQEQRDSFRAHIVKGTQNLLAPTRVADKAGLEEQEEEEEVNIEIEDDPAPEGFIDIDPPDEEEISPDEQKEEDFAIGGMDTTGRNVALDVFKRVETAVVDSYGLLDNEEDEEVFYDYLLTNLKLYMDKFEDDLKTKLDEPTTPEYEQEKDSAEGSDELEDEEPPPPEGEEDLSFGADEEEIMEFDYKKVLKIAEQ